MMREKVNKTFNFENIFMEKMRKLLKNSVENYRNLQRIVVL